MRTVIALFIGFAIGGVAGAGGMLIAYPFLFPLPVVNEAAPVTAGIAASPRGSFSFDETAPGRDSVHWANGSGSLFAADSKTIVRLEDNFVAGPGPNYWIYLNTAPVGEEKDFLADTGRVKIAPLKSFQGGQNYELPSTVDISRFTTLTIWCESFSAYIASAKLPQAKP